MKVEGRRTAFGLVELLVSIGVLGLMLGLVIAAVQMARDTALRTGCQNNLHQIGVAVHSYHDTHGRLPPATVSPDDPKDPSICLSWMAFILPQLGHLELYEESVRACKIDLLPYHNPPHTGFDTVISSYACPADARLDSPMMDRFALTAAFTSYVGIGGAVSPFLPSGVEGVLGKSPGIRLSEITDGASNTIMVGERPPPAGLQAGWWYTAKGALGPAPSGPNAVLLLGYPHQNVIDRACWGTRSTFGPGMLDNPCDRYHLWALHRGGANFLFADDNVRFLGYAAEPLMIPLATRNGGEVVDLPDL